ncbi:MAG TPA: hypothetical protein RMH80_13250, partial [Polyangiaceae bacterium LLY-WYZ-15_(1-7)]|nr:hypothetical protein [Polyangiaceae bacterium LLY-WYZ-15_(1-7)]
MSRSAGPAAFALAAFALALGAAPLYAQEGEGAERAPVTLVVVGDAEEAVLGAARESELPITLRVAPAPARDVAPRAPRPRPALSAARDAYVNADFEACLAALGSPDAVTDALGEGGPGARDAAARLAFWRVACHGAAGDGPAAERAAERMATLRLPIPADAALATPDLERLLADAYERVSARPPAALRVEASTPGRVQVDALESCAVPCERALPPGEHVLRFEADGAVPEARLAQAPGALRFEPAPAPPGL